MDVNKIVFRFVSVSFSILVMLLVCIGLFKAGSFCYEFGYRVFTEPAMEEAPGTDVVVQVTEDMSEMEIGKMLAEKGLVQDATIFFTQTMIFEYNGKLHPGVYTLNTSMEIQDMLEIMATEPEETTETEETETTEAVPETETDTETDTEAAE